MFIKNIKLGSATNSSSYHSTIVVSNELFEKYSAEANEIVTLNGLQYKSGTLALCRNLEEVTKDVQTQEQAEASAWDTFAWKRGTSNHYTPRAIYEGKLEEGTSVLELDIQDYLDKFLAEKAPKDLVDPIIDLNQVDGGVLQVMSCYLPGSRQNSSGYENRSFCMSAMLYKKYRKNESHYSSCTFYKGLQYPKAFLATLLSMSELDSITTQEEANAFIVEHFRKMLDNCGHLQESFEKTLTQYPVLDIDFIAIITQLFDYSSQLRVIQVSKRDIEGGKALVLNRIHSNE